MNIFKYTILTLLIAALPFVASAQLDIFTPIFQQNTPAQQNDFQLDLLWKAHTHTPAFYNGKPLPVNGSVVSVVALSPTQNTDSLTYFWQTDDVSFGSQGVELEGRGEDVFSFIVHPLIRRSSYRISVTAQNNATGQLARSSITIPVQTPETHLYLLQDGQGLRSASLDNLRTSPGSVFSLLAAPFYFVENEEKLVYTWSFGGRPVFGGGAPSLLELSIQGLSGSGSQEARVKVTGHAPGAQAEGSARVTVQP